MLYKDKLCTQLYHDIIECLVAALEAKDKYTSGHSLRVADMSFDLAKAIGLNGIELEKVHMAAHLHDIGKIGIPDTVLSKTSRLTEDEWHIIKMHPAIGYGILSKSEELRDISEIVLSHHESWDGNGYPHKLKGNDICIGARIISLCDAIDAMTSERPYRKPFTWEQCRTEVNLYIGKQFDPTLVEAANSLWKLWENRYTWK